MRRNMRPYSGSGRRARLSLLMLAISTACATDVLAQSVTKPATGNSKRDTSQPLIIDADAMTGRNEVNASAEGSVHMTQGNAKFDADKVEYRQEIDEVEATGNVKLEREGERISGPHLKLRMKDNIGAFDQPDYMISRGIVGPSSSADAAPLVGHGHAEKLLFKGQNHYGMEDASYTTCTVENSGSPDWYTQLGSLDLDYVEGVGRARNATVYFKDAPIFYTPLLSFPLNNNRKSGLLAPSGGSTTNGGFEYLQPFYWNIAPEMDATIAPRFMFRRGVQLQAEYRYLGQSYAGRVFGEYLGNDKVAKRSRYQGTLEHQQSFGGGFWGSLNLNGASDDAYFRDLSTRLTNTSQTFLLREGRLNYQADWWAASLLVQRYQTLQDPSAPITAPYDKLPQLSVSGTRADLPAGMVFTFTGESTYFKSPDSTRVSGLRSVIYPQLSLPWQNAAFFITPKLGMNLSRYRMDASSSSTAMANYVRDLPVFSLDAGMTFERESPLFGKDVVQTLEPRLFYLRVPYRDQSMLPVFDSGAVDFNFAQMFSENLFVGNDRIADANQATIAATSRFLDANTGVELARFVIGQRYYFADQLVTLPGVTARTGRIADFLVAASGRINRDLSLDSGLQYNPRDSQLERFNVGLRYQPELGRTLNLGYRYSRDLLRQIDISGQWPVAKGISAVGRMNYSLKDKQLLQAIAGLEYAQSCWSLRFVLQRLVTALNTTSSGWFLQLELHDFASIGTNPLEVLKRSVPGYSKLRLDGTSSEVSQVE